jgi:cation:H+ antiporter
VEAVILLASFLLILVGAELFTNGIEWFGHKLNLAEGAVGSVLAAVGTALPETTIPVVAIFLSPGGARSDVGVGAILGAPFMLSTLAVGVTGAVVLLSIRRRRYGADLDVDRAVVRTDLRAFAIAYALAIGAAFLPLEPAWPKAAVAVVLFILYGLYVKAHFDAEAGDAEPDLNPLRLRHLDGGAGSATGQPPGHPRLRIVSVQVAVGVGLIILGAVAFVDAVSGIARAAGMNELLLALIVAPIATELPEALNAILWIRRGKDTLAIGNITGAMVFQASIATIIALVFAPQAWAYAPGSRLAFASAGIAFLAVVLVFGGLLGGGSLNGRRLLVGGVCYAAYIGVIAFATVTG